MEFFQTLTCASDSVEYDAEFVKQEMEDDDIVGVNDNHDAHMNEQCITFEEEKPVIAEHFQYSAIAEMKQENVQVTSSAGAHNFVFVACADNVAFNEKKIENQIANSSISYSSARDEENVKMPCPYCRKNVTSLKVHTVTCELRFVYPCIYCPTVLYRKNNIKRHIQHKHSKESNSSSVEEIYEDIVIKRVELNVETAAEKNRVISEMMTNTSLRAKINARPVLTDKAPKFVLPNMEIQPKASEMPTSLFVIAAGNDVSQDNNVPNVIENPSTSKESANFGLGNEQQPSVHHRKINPIDKQCESGSTKIAATKKSIYCNECTYQTHKRKDLISHIRREHSFQLDLVSFQCWKCGKSFTGHDPMLAHKANCNAKPVYSCLFCPKVLLLKARILAHMRDQHAEKVANKKPNEIATLVEAKKKFVDFSNLKPGEQLAKTEIQCSNEPSDNDAVVVDSNTQQQSNAMPMKVVEKGNADVRNRCVVASKEHHELDNQRDRLNLQIRQCRNCEQTFTCRYDLNAHEPTCTIRVYFSCQFCKKILMRKNNIEKHFSQVHFKEAKDQTKDEIERLVEAAKRVVDTSIVKVQMESSKVTDTDKKSTKTLNTKKKSPVVDIQKENTTIIEKEKHSTKIKGTKKKIIKTKVQYLFCHHCQFKTRQKDVLANHIVKKHSAELNLAENRKDHFSYKCTFCPQVYLCMDKVKLHVTRKHSSELFDITVDEVAQEIFSKRTKLVGPKKYDADSFVDPDDIDATTLDHVLVYCDKCKTLKTTRGTLRAHKNNCRDCDARIVYVCSKCKNSHTLFYAEFRKHWSRCNEMNEISQDYLDKIVVYKCPQCQFSTIHKFRLNMHLARSKHKLVNGASGKSVDEGKNEETVDDTEGYDEDKFAVRTSVIDFSTMTHRYCPKCDKLVTEEMQPRKPPAEGRVCQVCKTRFHAQCVNCNIRRSNWMSMRYHLHTKCFPGEYLCIKCPQRTTNWQAMQKHYAIRHTNRRQLYLCEYCSFRNIHRSNFKVHLRKMHPDKADHSVFTQKDFAPRKEVDYACDLCSFTSKLKGCLKNHLHTVHSTKKHKCKLCKFKTRYTESLKRHVRTKHQNFY